MLTRHGKRAVAASTYSKGQAFVASSILLRKHAPRSETMEYVALHLLCQGIEGIVKGLLLFKNYDSYRDQLRKQLGHNLVRIAEEGIAAYGLNPLRGELRKELVKLNELYSKHLLRYGSSYDILVDPRTILRDRVTRRIGAVIRLSLRELKSAKDAI